MGYLMLADGTDISQFYISVPTEDGGYINVREDYFDQFPDHQYEYMMDQLDGVGGVSGPFAKIREKQKERRAERKDAKADKKAGRQTRRTNFLDKVLGTVKSFSPNQPAVTGGEKGLNVEGGLTFDTAEPPLYEKPIFWIGTLALVGVGAYLIKKNK